MSNTYRYISYASPSATWTYDHGANIVTLFWKENGRKIQYNPTSLHFAEHKERIIRLARERQNS